MRETEVESYVEIPLLLEEKERADLRGYAPIEQFVETPGGPACSLRDEGDSLRGPIPRDCPQTINA